MCEAIANRMKRFCFWMRWLTMSDRERYTYLWKRTRNSLSAS